MGSRGGCGHSLNFLQPNRHLSFANSLVVSMCLEPKIAKHAFYCPAFRRRAPSCNSLVGFIARIITIISPAAAHTATVYPMLTDPTTRPTDLSQCLAGRKRGHLIFLSIILYLPLMENLISKFAESQRIPCSLPPEPPTRPSQPCPRALLKTMRRALLSPLTRSNSPGWAISRSSSSSTSPVVASRADIFPSRRRDLSLVQVQ